MLRFMAESLLDSVVDFFKKLRVAAGQSDLWETVLTSAALVFLAHWLDPQPFPVTFAQVWLVYGVCRVMKVVDQTRIDGEFICLRCGDNEIEARKKRCDRSPCPMERKSDID